MGGESVQAIPRPASPRRGGSQGRRRSLRKLPSLSTVWEWDGHGHVDAVPSTDDVMTECLEPMPNEPMQGPLSLRSGPSWLCALGRCQWDPRFAVLQPATHAAPPKLLLFISELMEELHEELLLLWPLQLDCLPPDFPATPSGARFALSSAGAKPIELSAPTDELRQRWIYCLGESMRAISEGGSALWSAPLPGASVLPSSCFNGQVHLKQSRVSDHYRMGKVLAQGDDYMVVEGQHLQTSQSFALKLLSKHSTWLSEVDAGPSRTCSRLIGHCVDELYEGANHVCIVMRWGTHELDAKHQLAAAVLQALRLLREVQPDNADLLSKGFMMCKADTQKLLLRAVALDCHLQSNLFI